MPGFNRLVKMKNNKIVSSFYLELVILLFGMSVISAKASFRSGTEGLVFFLFQIGGVLLPGMAILSVFYIKGLTGIEQILMSYGLGFCSNIAIYFLVMSLGLKPYIKIVFLMVTIISIIVLFIKKQELPDVEWKEKVNITLLLGILFGYMLIVFSRRWMLPIQQKYYHQDLMFWVGDVIALKEKFVPINFRYLGEGYKYHYFGAMQIAVISMVTDIPSYTAAIVYSYIESAIFMAMTFYCFIKRFVKKRKIVFLTLFLMLFTTGIETEVGTYICHLYLLPMSFNIALCIELIIILLAIIQYKKEKLDINCMVLSCVFMMVCTGLKGPTGAIALCTIGLFCIHWLIIKKEFLRPIIYGLFSLIAFGIVFFGLLANMSKAYVVSEKVNEQSVEVVQKESIEEERKVFDLKQEKYEILKGKINQSMNKMRGYILYFLKANPWTFIPTILLVMMLLLKKQKKIEEAILFIVILVGSYLGYYLNFVGASQMYFTLAVFPLAAVLTGEIYEELDLLIKKTISNRIISTVILYVTMICIIWFGRKCTLKWEFWQESTNAWNVGKNNEQQFYFDRNVMTYNEYEAYDWVRRCIDEDVLLLSDRTLEEKIFSYIPGVFTERHVYYYGGNELETGERCYTGEFEAMKYFTEEKNIDYIMVTKRISPKFICDNSMLELVFSNPDVDIYKVL